MHNIRDVLEELGDPVGDVDVAVPLDHAVAAPEGAGLGRPAQAK